MSLPKTIEEIRNLALQAGEDLRAGKITAVNTGKILHSYKLALDSMRLQMDAARLGCPIEDVELNEGDRIATKRNKLRSVG